MKILILLFCISLNGYTQEGTDSELYGDQIKATADALKPIVEQQLRRIKISEGKQKDLKQKQLKRSGNYNNQYGGGYYMLPGINSAQLAVGGINILAGYNYNQFMLKNYCYISSDHEQIICNYGESTVIYKKAPDTETDGSNPKEAQADRLTGKDTPDSSPAENRQPESSGAQGVE